MSTSASAATSVSLPPQVRYTRRVTKRPRVVQGPHPKHAFGVILDDDCIAKWSNILLVDIEGADKVAAMSPKEKQRELAEMKLPTIFTLPDIIYSEFRHIPYLPRHLIVLDSVKQEFLFVFRDDSSRSCFHAPITPEDVKAIKKFLGIKRQGAKWHQVDVEE